MPASCARHSVCGLLILTVLASLLCPALTSATNSPTSVMDQAANEPGMITDHGRRTDTRESSSFKAAMFGKALNERMNAGDKELPRHHQPEWHVPVLSDARNSSYGELVSGLHLTDDISKGKPLKVSIYGDYVYEQKFEANKVNMSSDTVPAISVPSRNWLNQTEVLNGIVRNILSIVKDQETSTRNANESSAQGFNEKLVDNLLHSVTLKHSTQLPTSAYPAEDHQNRISEGDFKESAPSSANIKLKYQEPLSKEAIDALSYRVKLYSKSDLSAGTDDDHLRLFRSPATYERNDLSHSALPSPPAFTSEPDEEGSVFDNLMQHFLDLTLGGAELSKNGLESTLKKMPLDINYLYEELWKDTLLDDAEGQGINLLPDYEMDNFPVQARSFVPRIFDSFSVIGISSVLLIIVHCILLFVHVAPGIF